MPKKKPLINQETLDNFRELQATQDPDFIINIFTLLLETMPLQINSLKTAIDSNDLKQIRTIAHTFKSIFGNTGALHLQRLCEKLETPEVSTSTESAADIFKELKKCSQDLKAEILKLEEFKNTSG